MENQNHYAHLNPSSRDLLYPVLNQQCQCTEKEGSALHLQLLACFLSKISVIAVLREAGARERTGSAGLH